ncbi:MAG TPA: hypothetical protein VLQ91_11395 [Draconibacterium sp.]|nr:hypothetical protein [Draconibacterium sp.]
MHSFGDIIFNVLLRNINIKISFNEIIVTEWPEFRMPNFRVIEKLLKTKTIFDGRNIYEPEDMKELKFNYYSIGRKSIIISKD